MPTEKRFQCRHIFTDGHRCGSPTLLLETPTDNHTHEDFCYYHHTTRRPQPRARAVHEDPTQTAFALPLPEDRSAIQSAIGQVLAHIAANTLDARRAGLLLYGLQIAALNLPPHPRPHPLHERDEVPEPVTAIVTHPTHGPIAPTAELIPPPEYKSLGRQLWEEFGDPPTESTEPEPPTPTRHPIWGKLPDPYAAVQEQMVQEQKVQDQKQQAEQEAQQQPQQQEKEPAPTILPNLQAVAAHRGAPSSPSGCFILAHVGCPNPRPYLDAPILAHTSMPILAQTSGAPSSRRPYRRRVGYRAQRDRLSPKAKFSPPTAGCPMSRL
jgi:hypothetical protein